MAATVFMLDKYKELFKDESSFQKFAVIVQEATEEKNMQLVLFGESILGALISAEDAQENLRARIVKRLKNNPAILDKFGQRLESEDIVD